MNLSIIISTRNRSKLLNNTLGTLTCQTFNQKNFEVIVVDNGSTDNTKDVFDGYKESIKNIRYFFNETPGLHVGRHKGLKEAKSDILVYADDDIEVFPTWLEGISESFEDNEVVLVGGNNFPKFEVEPPTWILDLWNKKMEYGNALGYLSICDFGNRKKQISPYYIWGCNFSIRKKLLLKFKGFHPDSMPDNLKKFRGDGETYISEEINKFKLKAVFNPKSSVFHFVPVERMTLQYFYKRAFLQGISSSYNNIRKLKKMNRIIKFETDMTYYKKINIIKLKKLFKKITNVEEILEQGFLDGFHYHQLEVLKDNQLLAWVLKDNYLD